MSATIVHNEELVQSTAINPVTFTPTNAPTIGNAIIICFALVTKTRTVSSIADNGSNTGWAALATFSSSTAGSCIIWWLPKVVNAMTTFTITMSGTSKIQLGYLEVSGLTGVADSGATGANNTTASTTFDQAYTSTNADDFIVAGIGATPVPSIASGPFVLLMSGGGAGLQNGVATVEELSAGTYTAHWSLASSAVSSTAIAGFKVASSGISLNASLATVGSAGFSASERELMQASLATVGSAGLLASLRERATASLSTVGSAGLSATERERMQALKAAVSAVAFDAKIPAVLAERFRTTIWRPVIDPIMTKWQGWFRNP